MQGNMYIDRCTECGLNMRWPLFILNTLWFSADSTKMSLWHKSCSFCCAANSVAETRAAQFNLTCRHNLITHAFLIHAFSIVLFPSFWRQPTLIPQKLNHFLERSRSLCMIAVLLCCWWNLLSSIGQIWPSLRLLCLFSAKNRISPGTVPWGGQGAEWSCYPKLCQEVSDSVLLLTWTAQITWIPFSKKNQSFLE